MIQPVKKIIGQTVNGADIEAFMYAGENEIPPIFFLGGVHGDEIEGIHATKVIMDVLHDTPPERPVIVLPVLNVDGQKLNQRQNAHDVDLNRNLPTQDWVFSEDARYASGQHPNSEPENQALINCIDKLKPGIIISFHSFRLPMLNVNGDCTDLAQRIAAKTQYEVRANIGYPTPGSLGTYYGLERSVPVLTYEFLRGMDLEVITSLHVLAVLEETVFRGV